MRRTSPWTTLITQFKASPGRSGLLALLGLVLVVLLIRQVAKGPQSAGAASPAATAPIAPARSSTGGPAAARAAAEPAPRPSLPDLPDHPSRDPFAADWSLFARMPRVNDPVPPGDHESSPNAGPGLTLELTLTGPSYRGDPCAVINGRTVRVGDVIEGWAVESITSREVILSDRGQEQMALRMK